jgi:anaerobic selenocysteine-containing dehydrogenase
MSAISRRDLLKLQTGADGGPHGAPAQRLVPSACWQCVTRCPIVGVVEEGRLVKIDGNSESSRTRGRLCARGQAGVNQVYDPDRVLHPLVREGARGEGKWRRATWDEALGLLLEGGEIAGRRVKGLRSLREEGHPEKFLFHYGRTVGSDWLILMGYFLPAYGTGSVGDHSSICVAAGGVARALTGGGSAFMDFSQAGIILNFGNGLLEAASEHVPLAQPLFGSPIPPPSPRSGSPCSRPPTWPSSLPCAARSSTTISTTESSSIATPTCPSTH